MTDDPALPLPQPLPPAGPPVPAESVETEPGGDPDATGPAPRDEPAASVGPRPPDAIRVMSYNTRDFLDDRAAAARVVRAVDPDVLCLQEVPRRFFGATRVSLFARQCGMYWSGEHRGSGGTTVFTSLRVQVRGSHHYRLRVPFPDRTRGYAVVGVELPGRAPVTVASVHLSLKPAERETHAQAIMRRVGGWSAPLVLAGDLNEDETGAAWRVIAAGLNLVSPREPTFPVAAPERLLDVIFASPDLEIGAHRAVDLHEDDLRAASDHRPVWVDVRPRLT